MFKDYEVLESILKTSDPMESKDFVDEDWGAIMGYRHSGMLAQIQELWEEIKKKWTKQVTVTDDDIGTILSNRARKI